MFKLSHARRAPGWTALLLIYVAIAVALAIVVGVRAQRAAAAPDFDAAREASTLDFRDYWFTARHLLFTGEFTTDFGVHNYLPFFSIFMTPFAALPLPVAAVSFLLLSLFLFALLALVTESKLAGGLNNKPRRALLTALLLTAPYLWASSVLATVNVLLLFVIVAGWVLIENRRPRIAGACLALGVLIKLLPAALLGLLVLQRRWRGVGALALVLIVGGLALPLAVAGWGQTRTAFEGFSREAFVEHGVRHTLLDDEPRKRDYSNQSLPIVVRRLLTPLDSRPGQERPLLVNVAAVSRETAFAAYVSIATFIALATITVTLLGMRKPLSEDAAQQRRLFGLWTCVMLLAAPLVWTHYFVLAYWPIAVLADAAERNEAPRNWRHWTAVLALAVWFGGIVGLIWPAARASGCGLLGVLALWIVLCIHTLWPEREATPIKRLSNAPLTVSRGSN